VAAAYPGPYQINPKELPSNQNAAAIFTTGLGAIQGIVDNAGTTWSSSPLVASANGAGGMSSFVDTTTASRNTVSQTTLGTELARLQARQDQINTDLARISTPTGLF